jgi:hypothetical protein
MARIPASKRTRKRAPGEIRPAIAALNEAIAGGKIGWVLGDFLPCCCWVRRTGRSDRWTALPGASRTDTCPG